MNQQLISPRNIVQQLINAGSGQSSLFCKPSPQPPAHRRENLTQGSLVCPPRYVTLMLETETVCPRYITLLIQTSQEHEEVLWPDGTDKIPWKELSFQLHTHVCCHHMLSQQSLQYYPHMFVVTPGSGLGGEFPSVWSVVDSLPCKGTNNLWVGLCLIELIELIELMELIELIELDSVGLCWIKWLWIPFLAKAPPIFSNN